MIPTSCYRLIACFCWVVTLLLGIAGCAPDPTPSQTVKPPRPVSAVTLARSQQAVQSQVTGLVVAWKTEQLGFEVSGRLESVIEPNDFVEGHVTARFAQGPETPDPEVGLADQNPPPERDTPEGNTPSGLPSGRAVADELITLPLTQGTPVARLNPDRFLIAVDSAKAAVKVRFQQLTAIQVDKQRIDAQIAAAEANLELAETEFSRIEQLRTDGAVSRSERDRTENQLETAQAELLIANAAEASRLANEQSADAQWKQAQQDLAEANRNLNDSVLYSSFRGQVAATHLVAGSYVGPGDPVVTIQMMDPLSIEFEVSAEDYRRFRPGDALRVRPMNARNKDQIITGHVYVVDAVADPETRTFTVKLLVRNPKIEQKIPPGYSQEDVAFTYDLWPLNIGPVLGGDQELFAEAKAIHKDDQGDYVWRIRNRKMDETSQGQVILEVEKVRVEADDVAVPFLGTWEFVPVRAAPGETILPETDLIAGELTFPHWENPPQQWNGNHMILYQDDWNLRPGDLARIDLTQTSSVGWYVPMRMIRQESDQSFVFQVIQQDRKTVAKKVAVRLFPEDTLNVAETTYQRIEPVSADFSDGTVLVEKGVHYLTDGDEITLLPTPGERP